MPGPPQSRIPLRHEGDDPRVSEVFERVTTAVGTVPNLYRALAHAPALLEGWIQFAWELRDGAQSDRGLRELAILRVAQLTRSEYVWRSHFGAARRGGIDPEKLTDLERWRESHLFTTQEQAVLRFTDEVTLEVTTSDLTWKSIRASFDERQALELVLTVAWYTCVARVNAALEIPLDDGLERIPPLPSGSEGKDLDTR